MIGVGSSPHTWGTPPQVIVVPPVQRFIPTHVGNTTVEKAIIHHAAVHPHTRGEHLINAGTDLSGTGSSPHTWGTPIHSTTPLHQERFIPTHVGNTV